MAMDQINTEFDIKRVDVEENRDKSELIKAANNYLRDYFQTIKETCERYSRNPLQIFYPFDVDVNAIELMDQNVRLCNLLLDEPIEFQELLKETVYRTLLSRNWLDKLENIGQILLTVRVMKLPPFSEYSILSQSDLIRCNRSSFLKYCGIVMALTSPSKYTRGVCYTCPTSTCFGSVGKIFTRIHVLGAREMHTVRNDFSCKFCAGSLIENVAARLLGDKVIATMVPVDSFDLDCSSRLRIQATLVYFRDDQLELLKIGHAYSIIALPFQISNSSSYDIYLDAVHIDEYKEYVQKPLTFISFMFSNASGIRIPSLDEELNSFRLTFTLAYHFGESIAPKGLFHKVKLGILLALASCGNNKGKGNFSILVLSEDTAIINRLLRYGLFFAPRVTNVSRGSELRASISYSSRLSPSVEGNPLLLACRGVCYVGDLDIFSSSSKKSVADISESVHLQNSAEFNNETTVTYPLECQIWAYSNDGNTAYRDLSDGKKYAKHLLDAFKIIFSTTSWISSDDDLKSDLMIDCLLNAGTEDATAKAFLLDDLKVFLDFARSNTVEFAPGAAQTIQGYFIASRRASSKACELAISSVATLTLIAEAFAKLAMRTTVGEEEAVLAIYLYEEYLAVRYGSSFLGVQPSPHLLQKTIEQNYKMELDAFLKFRENLRQFVTVEE